MTKIITDTKHLSQCYLQNGDHSWQKKGRDKIKHAVFMQITNDEGADETITDNYVETVITGKIKNRNLEVFLQKKILQANVETDYPFT